MSETEDFYRQILDESSDPIFSFFPDGTYRYVNKAFAQGVNRPVSDLLWHKIWVVFPKEEADRRFTAVKHAFTTGEDRVLEVRVETPAGTQWYLTTVRPIKAEDGSVATVVCVSKNITERKRAEERLEFYASTDELTGVVNRRTALTLLQKLLDMARRNKTNFALMYADIDGLKTVNDTWGHAVGDQLIITCCRAVAAALRQADTLCRMGGDEFLILLPDCDADGASLLEKRIAQNLQNTREQNPQPWTASLSLGTVTFDDGDTADSLLKRLDQRMYERKRRR